MRAAVRLVASAACALGVAVSAWAAGGVAMVTDLTGEVRAGPVAVSILDELEPDTVIEVGAGARVTFVYLASGREYTVEGPASLGIGREAPDPRSGAAAVERDLALARETGLRASGAAAMQETTVRMRSVGQARSLRIREPRGVSLTPRPAFAWEAPAGATAFELSIRDGSGATVHEARTRDVRTALPENLTLRAGLRYTWRVRARLAGGRLVSDKARFEIASESLRADVERLRPRSDAPVSERVLFAVWLEREGLEVEARRMWETVAAERPHSDAVRERADGG